MNKREFIQKFGLVGLATYSLPGDIIYDKNKFNLPAYKTENDLWKIVRSHYSLKSDYINLENGYYNIIPNPTLSKYIEHVKAINFQGSYYMRNNLENDNLKLRKRISDWLSCDKKNIIISRNTTESLDLIIGGYPWEKGDEAIYAQQDYGSMKLMFEQVSKRYNMKTKVISIPNHPSSDEEIVQLYESQITKKTKLLMVCHMINITGQILPIKKICEMAHSYGVEVMVDGAHCIGHFDFSVEDLNCDYYGSSLHKWLSAPLGAGLLYIKEKHISKIWPSLAGYSNNFNGIKRLNHLGTNPVHIHLAINNALDYIDWIGINRKEKRLKELQNHWIQNLKNVPNVEINTPLTFSKSFGIGNVGIKNIPPKIMAEQLLKKFKIFTVAIDYANVKGCRITPNIYNSIDEIEVFIDAIRKLAS
jgi:selenocysteine lyase/cysteine desulfurase